MPCLLAGRWRARCGGQAACMVGCMAIMGASHAGLDWCEGAGLRWAYADGPVFAGLVGQKKENDLMGLRLDFRS